MLRKQQLQMQQQRGRTTLALFRVVPGDVIGKVSSIACPAVATEVVESDDDDDTCLKLFLPGPGDIDVRSDAPKDVEAGAEDPLVQLRLFPSAPKRRREPEPKTYLSTAEAAFRFRAIVQAVRAA